MIYLDYASNYPCKKDVLNEFIEIESKYIGNYNSSHNLGKLTKEKFIEIDKNIKNILNLSDEFEVIYTSNATESNNLAIKGIVDTYSAFGKKILVSELEHSSINGTLGQLKNKGFDIEFIKTLNNGEIDFDDLNKKLSNEVILVIVIFVEGETGYIHDYKKIKEILKNYENAHFLIDATQGIGKFNFDFNYSDLVSFSPHKFGGINGTGCLIKRKDLILYPLIAGGESNSIYRSGTPTIGLVASINKALEIAYNNLDNNYKYVKELNDYLLSNIKNISNIKINSFNNPYIINLSIDGINGNKCVEYLNKKGICISQKSACSIKNTPSKIIYSIYKDKKRALESFRISISDLTKKEEIDVLIESIKELIKNGK